MTDPCEKKQRHELAFCGCVALLVLTSACQQAPPDNRAADQKAIQDLEAQWSKAAGAKDLESIVSYYADDASMLPPNMPMATGKDAVRAGWAQILASPGFSVSWQSTKAEASRSGDLAYDIGTYEETLNDAQGKPMTDHGKYMVTWRKQADGKWKVVGDMFSSDMPPPAPPEKEKKKK